MTLDRRDLLRAGAALSCAMLVPGMSRSRAAAAAFAPEPGDWRIYEVVTRLDINPKGQTRAWVPLPSVQESAWIKPLGNDWTTNGAAELKRDPHYGADMLALSWEASENKPSVEVRSRFQTRDRAVDLSAPGKPVPLSSAERALALKATALLPTDGIVKATSDSVARAGTTDIEKARLIYDWVVDHTFRDVKVRGCGVGDIASMLHMNNLGGKCGDINALFVGLCRAAGIPARDIYGIRVAPSRFGYKSLGAKTEVVSKAQHCRAEIYLEGFGWVPADPADVTKVVREETAEALPPDDPRVLAARKVLFGAWESNWLPYNVAHDVDLPGAKGETLGFLMYPQAETEEARLDPLDPDAFKYMITAREMVA